MIKLSKERQRRKKTLQEFTEPFIKAFFDDLQTLKIEKAEFYPKATEYIEPMIEIIQKLIEKGFAYQSKDGNVYFSIEKFTTYGKLSHLKLDELKAGARVASDEYNKEHVSDFVLWKAFDPKRDGNIFWGELLLEKEGPAGIWNALRWLSNS